MPVASSYRGVSTGSTVASVAPSSMGGKSSAGRMGEPKPANMIPRPRQLAQAVYANDNGRISLQVQMHVNRADMKVLSGELRDRITEHLDIRRPFEKQDAGAYENYLAECKKIPRLRRYVDCWPSDSYAKLYLMVKSARKNVRSLRQVGHSPAVTNNRQARKPRPPSRSRSPVVSEGTDSPEVPLKAVVMHERGMVKQAPSTYRYPPVPHSTILTVSDFVSAIEPQQLGLVEVLEGAGVRTWAALQRMARDSVVRDEFLDLLLHEAKISRFQYVLLKDTFKMMLVGNSSM